MPGIYIMRRRKAAQGSPDIKTRKVTGRSENITYHRWLKKLKLVNDFHAESDLDCIARAAAPRLAPLSSRVVGGGG